MVSIRLSHGLAIGFSKVKNWISILRSPLPDRVARVFVQVVSPPLGWSYLSLFLVVWSPSGDTRGPSVVFEAGDEPCPGPRHFLTLLIIYMTFVLCLAKMLIFLSLWCWSDFQPQVCSAVLVWRVSRYLHYVIAAWQHTRVVPVSSCRWQRSQCLTYAAQPVIVLLCIFLSWFISSRLWWTRETALLHVGGVAM